MILYSTGTVFFIALSSPEDKAKTSESLIFICTREREKVHCKCTMWCTIHFIINLFNVGYVLLGVIYQLNFTVFMYVIWI